MFGLFQAVAMIYIKSGKCKIHSKEEHGLCLRDQLKVVRLDQRWDKARELRVCAGCLSSSHRNATCRRAKRCSIEGCPSNDHRLPHKKDLCKTQRPRRTSNRDSWQMYYYLAYKLHGRGAWSKEDLPSKAIPIALIHDDVTTMSRNVKPRLGGDRFAWFVDVLGKILRCSCCLLYTSPSPRDLSTSRMPSSA